MELNPLLDAYAQSWATNDPEQIAAHWAPERFVLYKAEEVSRVFHDWEEVCAYWRQNEGLHERIRLQFSDTRGSELAPGLRIASTRMRWDIQFAADACTAEGLPFPHRGQSMGGDNHVIILLCQVDVDWRLCGWSETPDAAITYLRSLYFKQAHWE